MTLIGGLMHLFMYFLLGALITILAFGYIWAQL